MTTPSPCKVAALHAAPVFLDKQATLQKALSLIAEAANNGAQLVVFPESYIPAYPLWAALWAPIYNHDLFIAMVENSLSVPGPELGLIAAAAKRHQVFVSLGLSETNPLSAGSIWNSNVLISDEGKVLNHHRKIVPTFYEKLVWAPGDGAGLQVVDTRLGKIGALICGENTNPLARYSLMAQGEQIHISNYPASWPTRKPTASGNYDNLAANRIRAAAHCFEAKVFGIVCAGFMDQAMRDFLVRRDPQIAEVVEACQQAASFFLDPTGAVLGTTMHREEGIAYAELDLRACIEPKQFHDLTGNYNRFDIFDLRVKRERTSVIRWEEEDFPPWPDLLEEE